GGGDGGRGNPPGMEETLLTGRRPLWMRAIESVHRVRGQLADAGARFVSGEATSGGDQWQRVVLNDAVRAHLLTLDPPTRTAAEISGDAHANQPWRSYTTLAYPQFDLCAPLRDSRRFDVVI